MSALRKPPCREWHFVEPERSAVARLGSDPTSPLQVGFCRRKSGFRHTVELAVFSGGRSPIFCMELSREDARACAIAWLEAIG